MIRENLAALDEFIEDTPKMRDLLHYYLTVEKSLLEEQESFSTNLERLQNMHEAVSRVVASQQQHANEVIVVNQEKNSLSDIADKALELYQETVEGEQPVTVVKSYASSPLIAVQKPKLIKVLINLYQDAHEAMAKSSESDHTMSVEIGNDDATAFMKVTDTGIGFDDGMEATLFQHGFSTKYGHSGYGLHNCANYITEMGGEIHAESDGPGQGASFVVSFPLANKKNSPAPPVSV